MALRNLWELRRKARELAEPGVDATPKEEVHREGKWAVRVVLPEPGAPPVPSDAPPVLLVPPLMVRPMVFDLQPDHSFVRLLRDRGLRTYVLDLGVPDRSDQTVRLDDYVLGVMPAAVDAVRRHAGDDRLSFVGYCMGGLFALFHAAAHPDGRLARIVTIGTPIDFERMGVVGLLGAVAAERIDPLVDALGVVPGWMANAGFQLLSGKRAVARLFALRDREADEAYLRSFGAISQWLTGLVPYPGDAFKQFLREVMARNPLAGESGSRRDGGSWLAFGEQRVDLGQVGCPVLAFAGATDAIAPVESVVALRRLLPPARVSVRSVPGGHVGILGGPEAPGAVWEPTAEFLRGAATTTG
jgi:polyhydroxyalkanoate synthase subunit PhaC